VNGYRTSARYKFVRARQLEGTFAGDKATGTWPITANRVGYGWGDPPEESWLYGTDWPPTEPSGIDAIAKQHRLLWPYRRVRTIDQCKLLASSRPVMVSLSITDKWANPWRGHIPASSATDIVFPVPHHVAIVGFNPDRDEFKFMNSWGGWGDNGYGYIRAERLAVTWWEGWVPIPKEFVGSPANTGMPSFRIGTFNQPDGTILHWLELVDGEDERMGWASAVRTVTSFEAEELFIRPMYRRAGHGTTLFKALETKSRDLGLPFKLWIPFPDASPPNLDVFKKIIRPSGLTVGPSGARWAPLLAASPSDQICGPIESIPYPTNPPAIPSEVLRLVAEIAKEIGTGLVASFLYDAIKSWINPQNGKRIHAKIGDMELSTSEVSPEEFRKLFKALRKLRDPDVPKLKATIIEACPASAGNGESVRPLR
jgi:hypothetical protein